MCLTWAASGSCRGAAPRAVQKKNTSVVYKEFSQLAYKTKKLNYIFLNAIYPGIMSRSYRHPILLLISVSLLFATTFKMPARFHCFFPLLLDSPCNSLSPVCPQNRQCHQSFCCLGSFGGPEDLRILKNPTATQHLN